MDTANKIRGRRLRQLRVTAGLSLTEVARRASLHPAILSDLERGTGTRRLLTYAHPLRLVLGEEVTTLVQEEMRDRAEAEALEAMRAQLTARLEQAALEFVMEGRPGMVGTWTGDPAEVATEPERLAKRMREVADHQRAKAAALTPDLLADRAGIRLGEGDRKITEQVCATWRELLSEDED